MKEIKNKKAYHDYFILDTIEVGIVLEGKEVKSIRGGKCNLKGSWCDISHNEMFVMDMHISPYQEGVMNLCTSINPYRTRKLLLHKSEIRKLEYKKQTEGCTFIPLKLYFSNGKVKMQLGICKGKKKYDKREAIKERDIKREQSRLN